MTEIWKDVVGYEGFYQVSNLGRVKSLSRVQTQPNPRNSALMCSRILPERIRTMANKNGYWQVTLDNNGAREHRMAHRLVLEAFVGNAPGLFCNHINGDRGDNRLENLEWVTRSENEQHKRDVLGNQVLDTNPAAKLTSAAVIDIRERMKTRTRKTVSQLAQKYGVSDTAVRKAASGETWERLKDV